MTSPIQEIVAGQAPVSTAPDFCNRDLIQGRRQAEDRHP